MSSRRGRLIVREPSVGRSARHHQASLITNRGNDRQVGASRRWLLANRAFRPAAGARTGDQRQTRRNPLFITDRRHDWWKEGRLTRSEVSAGEVRDEPGMSLDRDHGHRGRSSR